MSLSVEAATRRILDGVSPLVDAERLPIASCLERVLAADVISSMDVPSRPNSAMDGYAIRAADLALGSADGLTVVGAALAGHPHLPTVQAGQCVRITTGAPLPSGTDTVVMQEHVRRTGDRVILQRLPAAGENVRQPGEDIRRGDAVLSRGRRLTPADLGVLASLGIGEAAVYRRLRVALFSTGDELQPIDQSLAPGEVHDSNRYTLRGMLERLGAEIRDVGIVRDSPEALRTAFEQAADGQDAIVSSGGVSVGDADFVRTILAELGAVDFWKVAMKPGRPLTFGRVRDAVFFGLPGNPVSVMVTFYQFVQPALRRMMGESSPSRLRLQARCLSELRKRPGRAEFQRGILEQAIDGTLTVRKTGLQGSGVLSSMSQANCFIVLAQDNAGVAAGEMVTVEPFAGLI